MDDYFDIEEDEESGFFGLANAIWADADQRRAALKTEHGEDLGNWLADMRQYKSAWWGDVWQPEAIRAEDHIAFHTLDGWDFWDYKPLAFIVGFDGTEEWETDENGKQVMYSSVSRPAEYSIAGGRLIG